MSHIHYSVNDVCRTATLEVDKHLDSSDPNHRLKGGDTITLVYGEGRRPEPAFVEIVGRRLQQGKPVGPLVARLRVGTTTWEINLESKGSPFHGGQRWTVKQTPFDELLEPISEVD